MDLLRRTFLTCLVWLTAAMSVIAGVPHFRCVCTAASQKPLRPDHSSTESCCCGNGCCQTEHRSNTACCQHRKTQSLRSARGMHRIEGTGCTRALVPTQVVASLSTRSAAPVISLDGPSASMLARSANLMSAMSVRVFWQLHWRSPPADLVTTLQHLLI